MRIPYFRDAIAARESMDGPPKLTLVHSSDLETTALEADTARLQGEVRQLTLNIRATRQDLTAMVNLRDRKAEALETQLRALAARVRR